MHDVIVIGAGPSGSRIASRLASKGWSVRVIEEHESAGQGICCTGIVGTECYRALPVNSTILREGKSVTFFSPNGRTVRLQTSEPQAYILDRSALDRSLAEQATRAGADIVFASSVESIERQNGRVLAKTIHRGRPETLEARVCVLASGFNPGMTEHLGLGRSSDFAVGAQTEVAVRDAEEVEVSFSREFAPGFFTWIVPSSPGKALVGVICRERPGARLRSFLEHLRAHGRVSAGDPNISYGRIPLRPLPRSYRDRVLAVGDAAGQVKPTTGGGIYYGLLCADIGAEVLDRALLQDDLSASSLSVYEKRWKRLLSSELRVGYACRLAFERLGDRSIDTLFDIVSAYSLDKKALGHQGFSFDWHATILSTGVGHPEVWRILGSAFRGLMPGFMRQRENH